MRGARREEEKRARNREHYIFVVAAARKNEEGANSGRVKFEGCTFYNGVVL